MICRAACAGVFELPFPCRTGCAHFFENEAGAISAEYVTITAACMAIALAAFAIISGGSEDLVSETSAVLVELNPTDGFTTPEDANEPVPDN
jgi:hypothetical protein